MFLHTAFDDVSFLCKHLYKMSQQGTYYKNFLKSSFLQNEV